MEKPLTTRETYQLELTRCLNDIELLKLQERFAQQKQITDNKWTSDLGALQSLIKNKNEYKDFLERVLKEFAG